MKRGKRRELGRGLTWTADALTLTLTRWDDDTLSVSVYGRGRSLVFEADGFSLKADDRAELVDLFTATDLWLTEETPK